MQAALPLVRLRRIERAVRSLVGARLPQEISVAAVGTAAMRSLNRQRAGVNAPTDVLSFGAAKTKPFVGDDEGEIIICLPVARQQAREYGHPLADELVVLLTHGLLHLAGFDHHQRAAATRMRSLEAQVLRRMGRRAAGLITRADRPSPSTR